MLRMYKIILTVQMEFAGSKSTELQKKKKKKTLPLPCS